MNNFKYDRKFISFKCHIDERDDGLGQKNAVENVLMTEVKKENASINASY
jgi:hypothetical protein